MKNLFIIFVALLCVSSKAQCAEPIAKQYLRYIYGADGIDPTAICQLSDDLWMIRRKKDTEILSEIDSPKARWREDGIHLVPLGRDRLLFEIRDGKVDPTFQLEDEYSSQRRSLAYFLEAALEGNPENLKRRVTDISKLKIIGPKAPPGDMDVYIGVVESMAFARISKPVEDSKSKAITYRIPVINGTGCLSLTLVKDGDNWRVDTSKTLELSLAFFYI